MKKYLLFLLLLIFTAAAAEAQIKLNVKASLSNLFRYGSGTESNGGISYPKEYFEDVADGRLSVNDIIFGIRYEIDKPIEYGKDFIGIKKRFVEYKNVDDGIDLRAGDFWEIISRGLSMNVFEDRGQYYDTGIDGFNGYIKRTFGKKHPVKVKAQILGGSLIYNDFINFNRVETYNVRDANVEVSPVKFMNLGFNYVYSNGRVPSSTDTANINAYLPEGYASINLGDVQFFASYANKHVNVAANKTYSQEVSAKGDGFYSSLSFSKSKIGITLDYKNYRFDMTAPDNRATDRPTKMLPFQNPPTVVREQTSTLISRNPHVVDFNDEVGAQLDVVYAPSDKVSFNLNTAVASRHFDYINTGTPSKPKYERVARSGNFLPGFDNSLSPYWEVFLEGEWYATDKLYGKIAFDRQSQVTYSYNNPAASEKLTAFTIPTEIRYTFIPEYTLKFILEQQFMNNNVRVGDQNYMNTYLSVGVSKSPELSATVNLEFTNDSEDPSGKKFWALGELAYKLSGANTITASYGSERGGLRCTSGICRYVRPFEGFRLSISSKF
ncbi:MAG: DUF6029 family protein [Ignavibacteriae bacterium]|jgi:hypothetical protein|nr:DUF6029 family protein [Ignavibacteriota bacterium]